MRTARTNVYVLIDEERAYQDGKAPRPKSDEETSVAEWLIYMSEQLDRAKHSVYTLDEKSALEYVRKLTALGVACMEYNDTPARSIG
jgi:hypothetical protein